MALPTGGRFPVSSSLHRALVLLGATVAVLGGVEIVLLAASPLGPLWLLAEPVAAGGIYAAAGLVAWGSVITLGAFRYLDFAGESLRDLYTAAPNPETRRLYDHFKNADILMAMLDGLQVKRYLENRPQPGFQNDLGTLLALLSGHQKPVNLILTKWDILEDQYTFRQVVERLFQINQFAKFVRAQAVPGICRLIPVSSVGPGFVREEGNAMRKVAGKVINPVRVEVPVACALPDALTAIRQVKPGSTRTSNLMRWAGTMKLNMGILTVDLAALNAPPAASYLSAALGTPAATGQFIRYCEDRLTQFDRDFPESDLVRFMHQQGL